MRHSECLAPMHTTTNRRGKTRQRNINTSRTVHRSILASIESQLWRVSAKEDTSGSGQRGTASGTDMRNLICLATYAKVANTCATTILDGINLGP
jgi:hypothetical protein